MTEHDKDNDPTALIGAYAVNAVSADERAAVEAHLETSQASRNEATELQDTAVLLGLAAEPVTPSASLKERLMAQVAATPQLPPVAAPVSEAPQATVAPVAATAAPTSSAPLANAPMSNAPAAREATPAELKARSRWSRPALAVASVAAAAAIILGGGYALSGALAPTNQTPQATSIDAIRGADDMQQKIITDREAGTTATVMWSGELAAAAVVVDGMPVLPDDKVYELWYIRDNQAHAAGTFTVNEQGAASAVLKGEMHSGDIIGVTIEPHPGSDTPSTAPIMTVES